MTYLGLKEEDKEPFLFRKLGRIKEGLDDDQLTDIYQVCPKTSTVAGVLERYKKLTSITQLN